MEPYESRDDAASSNLASSGAGSQYTADMRIAHPYMVFSGGSESGGTRRHDCRGRGGDASHSEHGFRLRSMTHPLPFEIPHRIRTERPLDDAVVRVFPSLLGVVGGLVPDHYTEHTLVRSDLSISPLCDQLPYRLGEFVVTQLLSVGQFINSQPFPFVRLLFVAVIESSPRWRCSRGQFNAVFVYRHIECVVPFLTCLPLSGADDLIPARRVLALAAQ